MLLILPIMLCSDSHSHHLLCLKYNTCTVGSYIATARMWEAKVELQQCTSHLQFQEMHSEVYLLCSPGTIVLFLPLPAYYAKSILCWTT